MRISSLLHLAVFFISVHSRDVPANLKAFYEKYKNGSCPESLRLSKGFEDGQTDSRDVYYCKPSENSTIVYLKGPNDRYADLDIDCDGENATAGACSDDPTGQPFTAFQDTVEEYNVGVKNLDAHIHSYVVFGNEGEDPSFSPKSAGIQPLSIIAVVCGEKLVYGVWGDTNGGVLTGETSLATGQICFGDNAVSGNRGHAKHDVLYVAFSGSEAVPGAHGAKWNATTKEEFETSLATLGDQLIANLDNFTLPSVNNTSGNNTENNSTSGNSTSAAYSFKTAAVSSSPASLIMLVGMGSILMYYFL